MRRSFMWSNLRLLGFFLFISLGIPLFLSGCGDHRQSLVVAGSTSVQPVMEKIVEHFRKTHPDIKINVEGGGSSAGVTATLSGTAQLGMSSRHLKAKDERESKLTGHLLAHDAIVIIVNVSNPMKGLTLSQLRDIFSGRVKSWKSLGGDDHPIHLVVREEGSGTRSAFDELAMKEGKTDHEIDPFALVHDSMGGVKEVVRGDPHAIGFISLGGSSSVVRTLDIDGITPTPESVKKGEYKLIRPFLLLSMGTPEGPAKRLLDYALSSATTEILRKEGLVGVAQ